MKEKIYAKVFLLVNPNTNKLTKEEFNMFTEKFETIRKLYYDESLKRDRYPNFRAIVKEIKRAAHNAGLSATALKVDYQFDDDGNILLQSNNHYTYNLTVYFKNAANYNKRNNFIVTKFECTDYAMTVIHDGSYTDHHMLPIDSGAINGNIIYDYVSWKEMK